MPLFVKPDDWPECRMETPCGPGKLLNQLACNCFAEAVCDVWCGKDSTTDPVDGCSCITNSEAEKYYPDWATQDDISLSWQLSYQARDTMYFKST